MKYKIVFLFLLFSFFSFFNVICKNNENNILVLEPLDWEIMQCGKSKIGQKEKCTLFIINETDKPIQGYWLSNTNVLGKPKFAFIDANQSKKWDIKAAVNGLLRLSHFGSSELSHTHLFTEQNSSSCL